MDLKKVTKQGTDERTQEDYPTSAVYFLQTVCTPIDSFFAYLKVTIDSAYAVN